MKADNSAIVLAGVAPYHGRKSKSFAELGALMAYRNRPEGKPQPVKSNWTTIAANDNAAPDEIVDFRVERRLEVIPSLQTIAEEMNKPTVRNDAGQIVAIGTLRFSDGTQTERVYTYGADGKLIQYDARMPVGAMLGCRESADAPAGGKGFTESQTKRSNWFFADTLGTRDARYIGGRRDRRKGKSYSVEESRAMLAEATANTPNMPTVTKCPTALPCGSRRVADSFLGMQKAKKGESGTMMWQDIASAKVQREIWDEALACMKDERIRALDAAMAAKTLADISPGGSARGARKRGKRLLVAANDNLSYLLKKISA